MSDRNFEINNYDPDLVVIELGGEHDGVSLSITLTDDDVAEIVCKLFCLHQFGFYRDDLAKLIKDFVEKEQKKG